MKRIKGFTLTELMVALVVLGVICAAVIPAIVNNNPNQNKIMVKKAYYVFSQMVSDLINNPSLYPAEDGICPENNQSGYVGFDCNVSPKKLPVLFAKAMNIEGDRIDAEADLKDSYKKSSLADCFGGYDSCYVIETTDGMKWAFPQDNKFTKGDAKSSTYITVDVNGDKSPNCYQNSEACKDKTGNFDQLRMKLYADGQIEIDGDWAKDAVKVTSEISED